MKDEIKEILDLMQEIVDENQNKFASHKILLDYITNLQDKIEWYENIEINKTIDKFRLEHNKEIKKLKEENERLKNGYCELKVKCNNGECDCTNEEYEGMVQANMRGSLLLDDYKSRCEKLELENKVLKEQMVAMVQPNYVYGIELQGVGKDD